MWPDVGRRRKNNARHRAKLARSWTSLVKVGRHRWEGITAPETPPLPGSTAKAWAETRRIAASGTHAQTGPVQCAHGVVGASGSDPPVWRARLPLRGREPPQGRCRRLSAIDAPASDWASKAPAITRFIGATLSLHRLPMSVVPVGSAACHCRRRQAAQNGMLHQTKPHEVDGANSIEVGQNSFENRPRFTRRHAKISLVRSARAQNRATWAQSWPSLGKVWSTSVEPTPRLDDLRPHWAQLGTSGARLDRCRRNVTSMWPGFGPGEFCRPRPPVEDTGLHPKKLRGGRIGTLADQYIARKPPRCPEYPWRRRCSPGSTPARR